MKDRNYRLIGEKYREFFWPALAMAMANNMAVFVDSVLVSLFLGADRMPAIQLCYPMDAFVNMMYWMLGMGGSLLASNYIADHEKEKADQIFSISIITVTLLGLLTAVLGNLFMPQLSAILCRDASLRPYVVQYGRIMLVGMPLISFIMSISYFARADGSPNTGFYVVLISNIVNLCMDVVLLKIFGMGLEGASLATVIGYCCGVLYLIFTYLHSSKRNMRFVSCLKGGKYFHKLMLIVKKGIPTASTQLYMMLKAQIMNTMVLAYGGAVGILTYAIYSNSLFLVSIIIIGTAQTLSPIVSVYAHEGDYDRARYVLKRSIKTVLVGAVGLGALLALFPAIVLLLYGIKDPLSVAECQRAIRLYVLSYPGLAFVYIMAYYFQAIDRAKLSALTIAGEGLILPVAFVAVCAPALGMNGIWIAIIATEVTASLLILGGMYFGKRWNQALKGTSFLLPDTTDPDKYEFTVGANIKEAVTLSKEAQEWVSSRLDSWTATKTCLALEEMLTGIVMASGEGDHVIDVVLRQEDNGIIISMRDMTRPGFNPTAEDSGLALSFDNVTVLKKIAKDIKFDCSLGMNLTQIHIG